MDPIENNFPHSTEEVANDVALMNEIQGNEASIQLESCDPTIIEKAEITEGLDYVVSTNPVIESSSDSSDASDVEFSESDEEENVRVPNNAADIESDDENGPSILKTKNEIIELPPIEPINITIPENAELTHVGVVFAFVDELVIVEATVSGDYKVLDSDTILITENREIVGKIYDTFGPVSKPMYSIRWKQPEGESGVIKGAKVFYVPDLANFVFTHALKAQKGSDASNLYDEEIPDNELEFSDDEKEMEYKKALKEKKRRRKMGDDGEENVGRSDAGHARNQRRDDSARLHDIGRGGSFRSHGGGRSESIRSHDNRRAESFRLDDYEVLDRHQRPARPLPPRHQQHSGVSRPSYQFSPPGGHPSAQVLPVQPNYGGYMPPQFYPMANPMMPHPMMQGYMQPYPTDPVAAAMAAANMINFNSVNMPSNMRPNMGPPHHQQQSYQGYPPNQY